MNTDSKKALMIILASVIGLMVLLVAWGIGIFAWDAYQNAKPVSEATLRSIEQEVSEAVPDAAKVVVQKNKRPGINAWRLEVYVQLVGPEMSEKELLEVLRAIDKTAPADIVTPMAVLVGVNVTINEKGNIENYDLGNIEAQVESIGFEPAAMFATGGELAFYREDLAKFFDK